MRTSVVALIVLVGIVTGSPKPVKAQQLEQVVADLADQISESMAAQEKKKVAILPFTNLAGATTQLGHLLAEELTNQLFIRRKGRFDVVERSKVKAIWEEQKLGADGWTASDAVSGVGQLTDADSILTGTIAVLEDRLRLNARLMAVPEGKLFATASAFMLKTGLGDDMLEPMRRTGSGIASGGDTTKRATRTVKNVSFDLLGCEKQTRLIVCQLVVVNNDADMRIMVDARNRQSGLYDQAGRYFAASSVKLANFEDTSVRSRLITEVPTALSLHFQGVPSTIEFIKVLSFQTTLGRVEFRDVRF